MALQTFSGVTNYFRIIHIYKPPSKLCLCNSEDINVYIVELKKQNKNKMDIFIPLNALHQNGINI